MTNAIDKLIFTAFKDAKSIAIISHIRPDGDAIGSLLGLGNALLNAGKEVQMILEDGLPEKYNFLANSNKVQKKIDREYDMLVVVDSSDLERTGKQLQLLNKPDLCIDHHKTNENFARINLVEERAVAAAAIIAEHIPDWGLSIDRNVAYCLLAGILSDTIGFRTGNVDAKTLRLSADLMEFDVNLAEIYKHTLTNRSYEEMRYWGSGLNKLTRDGELIWTTLTLDDRIKSSYFENDDADLINILSAEEKSSIAIIFVEQEGGAVKVSWRSHSGIDVSGIAHSFGGGGHAAASGADIKGELVDVQRDVIMATKKLIKDNLNK
jgi:phosphoesterase RecJ-like protein